jgi:hypothetical protein
MRLASVAAVTAVFGLASTGLAANITGEYLEARTCDVYTGPCFANAEMDLAGKEAVMAWKVEEGGWNEVSLNGLGVAVVVNADSTLGYDGVFRREPANVRSVILVDEKATPEQREALIAFVKDSAKSLTSNVTRVLDVPITLSNDHVEGRGVFQAGQVAKIETRGMKKGDCVCTNEEIFYQPLTKVENMSPAYSLTQSFTGEGLGNRWTSHNTRSSFLATFRR